MKNFNLEVIQLTANSFCDKPFSLESNAKKQFFKIHVKSCQGATDDDDDIEVIKAVTADKSVER